MIAVDTNLLVYAHREDAKFHAQANAALVKLAAGTMRWFASYGPPTATFHDLRR
jgi:predicted nucleic acid-binding protein